VSQALPEVSRRYAPSGIPIDDSVALAAGRGEVTFDAVGVGAAGRRVSDGLPVSFPRLSPNPNNANDGSGLSADDFRVTGIPPANPVVLARPGEPISATNGIVPSNGPGTEVNESVLPTNNPSPADPTTPEFITAPATASSGGGRAILVEAEFPVAQAIATDIFDGRPVSGFARSPVDALVGNRRFGEQLHPISGVVKQHNGLDFGAPFGAPIYPVMEGTVISAGPNGGYGNEVIIEHVDGSQTQYAHMQGFNVSVGDTVTPNDSLGGVGSTGNSTGPHLHFEYRVDGTAEDPLPLYADVLPPQIRGAYGADAEVRSTQRMLQAVGLYAGEIDGNLGPATREGMLKFIEESGGFDDPGLGDAIPARPAPIPFRSAPIGGIS